MKSFREHASMLSEARSRGEAMEEVIVNAVNGKPRGNRKHKIDKNVGVRVADFLKKNGISGKGRLIGSSMSDVSKEWKQFWPEGKVPASTKTPKTDFIVGKTTISLKSGDKAQLMSGGKNESLATFHAAMSQVKGGMHKTLIDKLERMFNDLVPSSVASTNIADEIKNKKSDVINKAKKLHTDLMGELETLFNNNTEFRNAFAYEAMTGETKFAGNLNSCTHFLVTSFDGSNSKLKSVRDGDYIAEIAKQMQVSVRFKSSYIQKKGIKTGQYRYWSVVALIIDNMNEELNNILDSEIILTENMIKDFFVKIWKKIKAVFVKAIQYARQSTKNFFDFLDVQLNISFNNSVKF